MKKIKRKLNNAIKVLLACGMLFNNLMPLSIVFADETDNNVVVGENTGDGNKEINLETTVTNQNVDGNETGGELGNSGFATVTSDSNSDLVASVQDAVVFTASLDDDNLIIKHTGALELPEGKKTIVASVRYVSESTSNSN